LAHAVDLGDQKGKMVSWGANALSTSKEAYIGVMPSNADVLPF
jgi:hypothetical protein